MCIRGLHYCLPHCLLVSQPTLPDHLTVHLACPLLQASLHLITGHKNGGLIMWDSSHDMLKPVLRTRGQRSPVRGLAICEQLQLLAAGHANGKVLLRKLDPRLRLSPSREAGDTIWEPSKGEGAGL